MGKAFNPWCDVFLLEGELLTKISKLLIHIWSIHDPTIIHSWLMHDPSKSHSQSLRTHLILHLVSWHLNRNSSQLTNVQTNFHIKEHIQIAYYISSYYNIAIWNVIARLFKPPRSIFHMIRNLHCSYTYYIHNNHTINISSIVLKTKNKHESASYLSIQ